MIAVLGAAYTHRGHLHVSARDGSLLATVQPGDITDASPEAWLWIDGFLRGHEAGLFEFLGRSLDLLDNHDDADIARWLAWNQRFRRHGWASPLWPVPAADPVLSELCRRSRTCVTGATAEGGRLKEDVAGMAQLHAYGVTSPQPSSDVSRRPACDLGSGRGGSR